MFPKYPRFIRGGLPVLALCLIGGCDKSSSRTPTIPSGKPAEKTVPSSEITRSLVSPEAVKAVQPTPAIVSPAPTGTPAVQAPVNPQKGENPPMRLYDRIQTAVDQGQMTLKEAVLLEAKLIYKPALLPADSPYRPGPQDSGFVEECLTGFNKDVHRVFPELSAEERELLKSLDPGLKTVIEQKEKEASKGTAGKS